MDRTYAKALLELVVLTYAVSVLGLVTADGFDVTSLSAWKTAAVAGVPAVLAAVYGVVARLKGNFRSPLTVDTRDTV